MKTLYFYSCYGYNDRDVKNSIFSGTTTMPKIKKRWRL